MFSSGLTDCKRRRIYICLPCAFPLGSFSLRLAESLWMAQRQKSLYLEHSVSIVWSLIFSFIQMHERGELEVELPLLEGFGSFFGGEEAPICLAPQMQGKTLVERGEWLTFEDKIDKVRDYQAAPPMMKAKGTSLTPNCRFIHIFVVDTSQN